MAPGCTNNRGSLNVVTDRMPFCTNCGNQVSGADIFCASCGFRQTPTGPTTGKGFLDNISHKTAAMACYIPFIGWIPAIVVLASPRFQAERAVRFHAFQGLYLFVVWLIVDWVLEPFLRAVPGHGPMRGVAGLLHLTVFAAWIWMIIKTSQEQMYHLPIVGELAERSVAEQR
jgi:uncharacterized membrane protein